MFDLISLLAKLSAINVLKIKKINDKIQDKIEKYSYEIIRFFSLTNGYSIRNEKIKRRILEFCTLAQEIKKELNISLEEKYGTKESNVVSTNIYEGFGILVSGDDIDELEKVLDTIEKIDLDEDTKSKINVYTNGALFLAHFYPYFKKNKYLKGHFGADNAEYDFSVFDGAILITQNFIQKIDSLYRGEIFSNKLISFSKVSDIKDKNYKPVIETALKMDGCKKSKETTTIKIDYDRQKIKKFIDSTDVEEIVVISGLLDAQDDIINYENKKIVKISCPLEGDILLESIAKLKEKGIKITVFLAQCNLITL